MQSSYYRVLVCKGNHTVEAVPSPRSRKAAIDFGEKISAAEPDAEIRIEMITHRLERIKTIRPTTQGEKTNG